MRCKSDAREHQSFRRESPGKGRRLWMNDEDYEEDDDDFLDDYEEEEDEEDDDDDDGYVPRRSSL
jgi:hypothetical protein